MSDEEPEIALPRSCRKLFGQDAAVSAFERALGSERLHHGWLLCGSKGVGKASFAHLASHALIAGNTNLTSVDGPDYERLAAGNEPRLRLIERISNPKTGKLRTQIAVEQIRDLRRDLTLAADAGAWRCVIVDAADDMNVSAANSLLKILEEPPERVAFFLIAHAPGRLLPTIRSRCRRLEFAPLDGPALDAAFTAATHNELPTQISALSEGSVATAVRLTSAAGATLAQGLDEVLAPLPQRINRAALHALCDKALGNANPDGLSVASDLLIAQISELSLSAIDAGAPPSAFSQTPATGPAHAALWASLAAQLRDTSDRAIALNLDPRQCLLDMVTAIETTARDMTRRP